MNPFDYSDFERKFMDRQYIQMLQRPRVRFFDGCKSVLDLACGPGFFLELLKEAGIHAVGVDRNEAIVERNLQRGLRVVHSDVFSFLESGKEPYDGIFCSHLLEHLPFSGVVRTVELIADRLNPRGVLVLVFPNPASIRLHLFGFWRDPEHVRFYTGNLIASVCEHYGLSVRYSNEEETPNRLETPLIEPLSVSPRKGFFCRRRSRADTVLQEINGKIEEFNKKMALFSEAMNKVWSSNDEVVLVCRKEGTDDSA
jgi:SAM-dependent methyltransferase